ncbi:hypothetical protein RclHR1_01940007 [Rhizophagus clarus]|uniref:Uncharacterized protein n=1 Tax=Rhizophagus clarus TaxID=94130 RepID=A0A2Z6QPD4_9GLOM|nr:hypothetical protein RclHR1_01940007 [Rhizophagus clarus]GES93661.1 hypothetical protein RCL_e6799_RclHR1_01940007 [Rhizophagus clarus]
MDNEENCINRTIRKRRFKRQLKNKNINVVRRSSFNNPPVINQQRRNPVQRRLPRRRIPPVINQPRRNPVQRRLPRRRR